MDLKTKMESLFAKIHERITYRDVKIAGLAERGMSAYEKLSEINRHIELLTADLRASLIECHYELQALGFCPQELSMQDAPEMDIQADEKSVRLVIDGILPFPIKGSAYYLHEKLDSELRRLSKEDAIPPLLFNERCAVVFIHHYAMTEKSIRNIRDYDNVEHRCITNVIARHFLRDDSPACYISIDVLAPGDSDYTEVRIMTIPAFRAFVISEKIDFTA